ncbi:N-acetyltransferase B complex non catalytic subunit-domain-containing protein [Dactylonectria macrodidyma]|uniref:N-acetyltransferase B complex non catalytic subunit-domain-containing protein n=1 Tax=Dactylonectria macrodidyma TaxID=307937 RepID=A0A9P9IXB6_9HYPO|nr:N-acetyltransferase B complex non catalytic subunit-domain-containing protein [Dactylonectria macrodidyma]
MNRQRPSLRNGVDLQLQSAFSDGNWAVVIRLAEKRARTHNDQYYQIVKVCAESQLDDPGAKFAAVAAVAQYVKDGTVVKDVDGIDLLEWASQGLGNGPDDFSETLGTLRARLVKAAPKDKIAGTRCLESCLLHWDLVSAQQIAAILDRSFPQERSFMFWNIVITHMLATSGQSPPEKKKLYGMLALKQIQRAAQLAEQTQSAQGDEAAKPQPRSIQSEEEILLLYDIIERHGTSDDFEKLMSSPVFCPLVQFQLGRKELVIRTLAKHQRDGDSEAIYRLCKDCLSTTKEDGNPNLMASDWSIWRQFIDAAAQIKSVDPNTQETVQDLLLKFVKIPNLPPIYKRIIILARASAAFNLTSNDSDDLADGQPASLRLKELIHYVQDQGSNAACFDDIKGFVERLDPPALKYLAYEFAPQLADDNENELHSARIRTLSFKLQYFAATCPSMYVTIPGEKPLRKCIVTDEEIDSSSPGPCFATVAKGTLELYQSLVELASIHAAIEAEIKPDLAVLIALCNIQSAFPPSTDSSNAPVSLSPLIRAALILEHQLPLTPKHGNISLLLVQLHIFLGAAPRAREIWETLGVKRTIMDSLAPIFYDRLSTISPSIIAPNDTWGWELMELLHTHYSVSLKLRMPRRLIDAFESSSYGSVIDIPRYIEALRWSCTRAMSLVEETRTERIVGQRFAEVLQDDRYAEVTDDVELNEVIDYGSFPSWDCSSRPIVYTRLRIGPPPTNRRAHLSLLSEAFHEVLTYKPPAVYKASAAAAIPEQTFILEMLSQLSNSFTKFLNGPKSDTTQPEAIYFDTISLLTTLIPFTTEMGRPATVPDVFNHIVDGIKAAIETLGSVIALEENSSAATQISSLSSMHAVAIFRDTADATKQAVQWILAANERQKERDRSGNSNLPKDVVAQLKALLATAESALNDGKAWIGKLKQQISGRDFESAARQWIFEDGEDIQAVVSDDALTQLVKSWEANIKGWTEVKWT